MEVGLFHLQNSAGEGLRHSSNTISGCDLSDARANVLIFESYIPFTGIIG